MIYLNDKKETMNISKLNRNKNGLFFVHPRT